LPAKSNAGQVASRARKIQRQAANLTGAGPLFMVAAFLRA